MIAWTSQSIIAAGSAAAIALYLALYYLAGVEYQYAAAPLLAAIVLGGTPIVLMLFKKLSKAQFDADLLAGISIVTGLILGEHLAACIVVLMLSGGEALENLAMKRATSVLDALVKRMPTLAHRQESEKLVDIPTEEVAVGDQVVIFPHELCPVDGTVIEGHGTMDESFLTGEPFKVSKTKGASVISGAINGESALTIRAEKRSLDSRYAKIMQVMLEAERNRPPLRRMGDKLGALYTPIALSIAGFAWLISGDATRFLSVLVVATPCPLLIAIPVAIIGSISLAAKKGIVIKNPAILEQISNSDSLIFDKTGTLTYGKPELTDIFPAPGFDENEVLKLAAGLERYSKHPLASAILERAEANNLPLVQAEQISEKPGAGLEGLVNGRPVRITGRKKLGQYLMEAKGITLPPEGQGLECVVMVDESYAATFRFRDAPREDSEDFISHLEPNHKIRSVLLVSGDRESEVQYLADRVGIRDVYFNQSPEDKVKIVEEQNKKGTTLFVGDGINDAPALAAATIGVAFGQGSEITSAAADAVVLETDLRKIDELFHIGRRMSRIAMQSAVGGMAISSVGMLFAAAGYLTPVAGAILQEVIDLAAVLNSLRAAKKPGVLSDY